MAQGRQRTVARGRVGVRGRALDCVDATGPRVGRETSGSEADHGTIGDEVAHGRVVATDARLCSPRVGRESRAARRPILAQGRRRSVCASRVSCAVVGHSYVLRAFGLAIARSSTSLRLARCYPAHCSYRAPPAAVQPADSIAERHGWREVELSVLIRWH
jgi:hypothetical protein